MKWDHILNHGAVQGWKSQEAGSSIYNLFPCIFNISCCECVGMGGDGGFSQVVATIFKLDKSELVDLGCAGSVTWWHKSTPTQNCLFWFFLLMRFECRIQIHTPFLPPNHCTCDWAKHFLFLLALQFYYVSQFSWDLIALLYPAALSKILPIHILT